MDFYKNLTPFKKELFKISSILILIFSQFLGGYFYCICNDIIFTESFGIMLISTLIFVIYEVVALIVATCSGLCLILLYLEVIIPTSKFMFSGKYYRKIISLYRDDYPKTKYNKSIRWIKTN